MRQKIPYLVIAFASTSDAMAMEKFCLANNVPGRLIPLPKEISAGCGLAWRTEPDQEAFFQSKLEEAAIRCTKMCVLELWG